MGLWENKQNLARDARRWCLCVATRRPCLFVSREFTSLRLNSTREFLHRLFFPPSLLCGFFAGLVMSACGCLRWFVESKLDNSREIVKFLSPKRLQEWRCWKVFPFGVKVYKSRDPSGQKSLRSRKSRQTTSDLSTSSHSLELAIECSRRVIESHQFVRLELALCQLREPDTPESVCRVRPQKVVHNRRKKGWRRWAPNHHIAFGSAKTSSATRRCWKMNFSFSVFPRFSIKRQAEGALKLYFSLRMNCEWQEPVCRLFRHHSARAFCQKWRISLSEAPLHEAKHREQTEQQPVSA